MSRRIQPLLFLLLFTAIMLLVLSRAEAQMDASAPTTEAEESWLILPDMPETATHANYGAEIYRLVCRDCHGGVGQGLTDEWRAEGFAPEDQNCWQSKCHNGTHPVEGFVLPKYVPPIAGELALARFETAFDLYNYIRSAMPYHNRGSLLDIEYMQLTAFIAELNGLERLPATLDETVAEQIVLHPDRPMPTLTHAAATTQPWLWGAAALCGLLAAGGVVFYRRR
jgi:cytochrome c5